MTMSLSPAIPVLEARALRKTFPSGDGRIRVLEGLDFEVQPAESLSIRGESGSGKSTLLHLLAGLDKPDSGTLRWEGREQLDPPTRGRRIGIVFQAFHLIPEMDAFANVLMARRIVGPVDAAARERARSLLAQVGLSERGHHLPSRLSGGERQRVAVARALMNEPRLVLADEPTGNLDERSGEAVIDLLIGLCASSGTALVLVTHNAAHAERCSRRLLLREGRLHEEKSR
jgi:predicted ABC-type transport system involved in lysophospholipase L1 biosynthesis ATPase subunit